MMRHLPGQWIRGLGLWDKEMGCLLHQQLPPEDYDYLQLEPDLRLHPLPSLPEDLDLYLLEVEHLHKYHRLLLPGDWDWSRLELEDPLRQHHRLTPRRESDDGEFLQQGLEHLHQGYLQPTLLLEPGYWDCSRLELERLRELLPPSLQVDPETHFQEYHQLNPR
jgi:hypothetical protein